MSLLNTELEMLRRVPLFSGIEPARLKLLAFTSELVTFPKGTVLVRQGEIGDAAYVIFTGEADVVVAVEGTEIVVNRLGGNDFVGEIAILCDVPRTATVVAATNLTALRITKENIMMMLSQFPEMAVEMLRVLASRLQKTTADLVRLQRQVAAER